MECERVPDFMFILTFKHLTEELSKCRLRSDFTLNVWSLTGKTLDVIWIKQGKKETIILAIQLLSKQMVSMMLIAGQY